MEEDQKSRPFPVRRVPGHSLLGMHNICRTSGAHVFHGFLAAVRIEYDRSASHDLWRAGARGCWVGTSSLALGRLGLPKIYRQEWRAAWR